MFLPGLLGAASGIIGRVLGTALDEVKSTRQHRRDIELLKAEVVRDEKLMELELRLHASEATAHAARAEAELRDRQAQRNQELDLQAIAASAGAAMASYDYDKTVLQQGLPPLVHSIIALRKDIFLAIIGTLLAATAFVAMFDPIHRTEIVSAVVLILPEIIMAGVMYLFPRISSGMPSARSPSEKQ